MQEAADLDEPRACPCEFNGCTPAACNIRLALHEECAKYMDAAEIDVDGHIEAELLTPGSELLTCSRVEPGEARSVHARGEGWSWGPEEVFCASPGGHLHTLTFRCDGAGQADDGAPSGSLSEPAPPEGI